MNKDINVSPVNIEEQEIISFKKLSTMEGFIIDLSLKIERAECIIQDLTEDYFSIDLDNPNSKEELWKIQAGYDEYAIRANIVQDYLYDIRKAVETANKFIHNEYEKSRIVNCKICK